MTKKRMSPDSFTDLCSAAELLSVPTKRVQPLENGQSSHGKIASVQMSSTYTSPVREASFFFADVAQMGNQES